MSSNAISARTKITQTKSDSKASCGQAQQPQQIPNVLLSTSAEESDGLQGILATYLDTHGFPLDLCSSFTYALLETPTLPQMWSGTSCKARARCVPHQHGPASSCRQLPQGRASLAVTTLHRHPAHLDFAPGVQQTARWHPATWSFMVPICRIRAIL